MLSTNEEQRYSRQLNLPAVGQAGQQQLAGARVLLVGIGGLGCPAAQYLAAMGVGELGLLDFDLVSLSNLNRQLLYTEADLGRAKAEVARERLQQQNPYIRLRAYAEALTRKSALRLFPDYDVIIDGTDNLPAKYIINDACVWLGKPWVSASLHRFQGQLAVFNYQDGPSYRCLFPSAGQMAVNCEEAGVLGVVPGILGSYQALEAIKILLGLGNVLSGRLKLIDFLQMKEEEIRFTRQDDQVALARQKATATDDAPKPILCQGAEWYLDVREEFEEPRFEHTTLLRIPLRELALRHAEIPRNKPVWVYCQSGQRSREAVDLLTQTFGFRNLKNMEGGIADLLPKT